jgi:peptidoglycan/xylan/chitin deacetylase (PgdA/CDA1 family)
MTRNGKLLQYHLGQLALILMRWIGLIRLLQFFRRNQIVILTVHGVMDQLDNPSWKPLKPRLSRNELEKYLKILSKHYHFVSILDAVDMIQGHKPVQPYSLVLTFDDGYRNNFTHALPILRRYSIPATFFIPTGFVDNPRPFCSDRLDYAVQNSSVDGRELRIGDISVRLDGSSRTALRESFRRLRRSAKALPLSHLEYLQKMEELAVDLENESGGSLADIQADDDWSAIVTWEQLEKIGNDDVTIGSHTVDHSRLGLVDVEFARDQLVRSKRNIEFRTGRPCLNLCYPNGNFTQETISLAKEAGYVCGTTTTEGLNRVGDDIMKLRRINMSTGAGCSELLARTCGLSQTFSHTKACVARILFGRKRSNCG